jgi:hypothetical protein
VDVAADDERDVVAAQGRADHGAAALAGAAGRALVDDEHVELGGERRSRPAAKTRDASG